ncbi:putative transcription factor bZIP family [Helianthus annuus]|nr:putative transcription factor bZIP family [Helianthus annuus]
MKHKAKPSRVTPRKHKIRKTTAKAVEDTTGESVQILESVTVEEPMVQAEVHVPTPPTSPIQELLPVKKEAQVSTPPQQTKNVEEPSSTSKETTTPIPQSSSQSFPDLPSNLGPGPTSLDDIGDIPFFNDLRVDGVIKRVDKLEKAKAETDEKLKASDAKLKATEEKLKNVEAENVALKNEVHEMNEKIEDLKAGNNALNEMIDELLTTNVYLNDSHPTMRLCKKS